MHACWPVLGIGVDDIDMEQNWHKRENRSRTFDSRDLNPADPADYY
jgi:hypothetical protein